MSDRARNEEMRALLLELFDVAVRAAQPERVLSKVEPEFDPERTFAVAVGKAAAGMARVAYERFGVERGLSISPALALFRAPCAYRCIEAGHPEPNDASLSAGEAAMTAAMRLGEGETLLVLISGGASALMEALPPSIPLADLQSLNRALLRSGAPIAEINVVRRRVSRIKGGRLAAAAWPASTLTLALSDVPGDRLADIGSGPTIASDDPRSLAEEILAARNISPPATIEAWLRDPMSQGPASNALHLSRTRSSLVGSPLASLRAAAERARGAGFEVVLLGDCLQGDARELGEAHAVLAIEAAGRRVPTAFISGGETTVQVRPGGRGGRNKTYLAAAAARCGGHPQIWGLAADSDGLDGTEDDAGAWFGPQTLADAAAEGWSAEEAIERCDTYGFFEAAGALIDTGPTGTNVNDVRVLLVTKPRTS